MLVESLFSVADVKEIPEHGGCLDLGLFGSNFKTAIAALELACAYVPLLRRTVS
ncbi:hypothetical protein J4G37_30970 [Microvirga sp. 3-52]|nr:hypothetical protein [Microvirga sp. 3-52]